MYTLFNVIADSSMILRRTFHFPRLTFTHLQVHACIHCANNADNWVLRFSTSKQLLDSQCDRSVPLDFPGITTTDIMLNTFLYVLSHI